MADITSNLVVYYSFDNDRLNYATGTGVADTTNFGTTIDGANYQVGGGSLSVGSSKYLQMSNATTAANFYTAGSGVSFAFWLYYSSYTGSPSIFAIGDPLNPEFLGLQLQFANGANLYPYYHGVAPQQLPIVSNAWIHIVWTISTGGVWTLYKDGTQAQQYTQVYPTTTNVGRSYLNVDSTSGTQSGYFVGNLDEFRIYQRVLSATDVAALYNYTAPANITGGLVVYYPFDTDILNYATGSGVSDSTNNGTTISTTSYQVGTGALSFGNSQFIQMNNITTQSALYSNNALTIAFWITITGHIGNDPRIFDIGDSTGSNYLTNMYITAAGGGSPNFKLYVNNSSLDLTASFPRNVWTHFVWTLSTAGTWSVYKNGVSLTSTSGRPFPNVYGGSYINRSNMGTGDGFVIGDMDEFRIYQRVLSATEALALYNYTGPTPEPSPAENIPCFREGTQILCFHNGKEEYIQVEKLRTGTLVKTLLFGYIPIDLIGKKVIHNPGHLERIEKRLYLCSKEKYPELFEDLYITGDHSILVEQLTEEQKEKTLEIMEDIFITDNKYRLLACLDERTEPFAESGKYTIYHFALENDNYQWNYGVYANGLLVESCSKEHIEMFSGMEII